MPSKEEVITTTITSSIDNDETSPVEEQGVNMKKESLLSTTRRSKVQKRRMKTNNKTKTDMSMKSEIIDNVNHTTTVTPVTAQNNLTSNAAHDIIIVSSGSSSPCSSPPPSPRPTTPIASTSTTKKQRKSRIDQSTSKRKRNGSSSTLVAPMSPPSTSSSNTPTKSKKLKKGKGLTPAADNGDTPVKSSLASPSPGRKRNRTPIKSTNQPSIGSFFTTMKPKKDKKNPITGIKNDTKITQNVTKNQASSTSSSTSSSRTAGEVKDTKIVKPAITRAVPASKSVLEQLGKDQSPQSEMQVSTPSKSRLQSPLKEIAKSSSYLQSTPTKPTVTSSMSNSSNKSRISDKSTTKKKRTPRKCKPKPSLPSFEDVVKDDDILAIVLGTHEDKDVEENDTDDADDKSKSSSGSSICGGSTTSTSLKKAVHLPDLITQNMQQQGMNKSRNINAIASSRKNQPLKKKSTKQEATVAEAKVIATITKPISSSSSSSSNTTVAAAAGTVTAATTPPSSTQSKKSKKNKDPLKPKYMTTAYQYFFEEINSSVKKENPDYKYNELAKHIGKLYRQLPKEDRKKYDDLALVDKARYNMEMKERNLKQKNDLGSTTTAIKKTHIATSTSMTDKPRENQQSDENTEQKQLLDSTKHSKNCHDNANENDPTPTPEEKIPKTILMEVDNIGVKTVGEDDTEEGITTDNLIANLVNNEHETLEKEENSKVEGLMTSDIINSKEKEEEDDEVTLGSDDDNISEEGDNEEIEKEEHVAEKISISLNKDDEFTDTAKHNMDMEVKESNTHPQSDKEETTNIIEMHEEKESVVNVLQPRKKSKPVIVVNTLQPRKKVKVNELQPRNKIEINELQPRKKLKTHDLATKPEPKSDKKLELPTETNTIVNDLQDGSLEDVMRKVQPVIINNLQPRKKQPKVKVNELQPRKKSKTNDLVTKPEPPKPFEKLQPPIETKASENDLQKGKMENVIKIVQPVIVNKLQPRKKQPKGKVNEIQPHKKKSSLKTKPEIDSQDKSPATPCLSSSKDTVNTSTSQTKLVNKNPASSIPVVSLSEDEKELLAKYATMRSLYLDRAKELVDRAMKGSVEEEDFQSHLGGKSGSKIEPMQVLKGTSVITEFKDDWVQQLAIVVQGSSLPLNEISNLASRNISNGLGPNTVVAVDAVAAKVKLLAARTQYLSLIPTFNTSTSGIDVKVDIFTDTNMFNMWRWELASIDLLPDDKKASVKKARGSRKRLKYHQKAILKLVQSIDDFESFLKNASKTKENQQRRIAKISTDEEKVLKYEREEEKARLLLEAKVQKEKEKRQKLIEKEAEKDRKKEEVTKKQAEKARLEAEKGIATKKQKARMMSFFMTNKSTKAKPDVSDVSNSDENVKLYSQNSSNLPLDSGTFWKQLGCGDSRGGYFNNFSSSAINSRRRKTRKVNIRVFATVVSENPFEQQPYDEERVISVWNKKKYFNFHEDYRPPYHGTWNKPRSKIISGKNPFGKDTTFLNYDVDSEAEWEEGDNEQGDDCSIEDKDEEEHEEDEDTTKYNYQDGWLTQDADLALDDDDEETMVMRKQKAEGTIVSEGDSCHHQKLVPACIIAPIMGGLPQLDDTTECPQLVSELVEGIRVNEAHELLSSHEGELLMPSSVELCFDPFPLVKSEKKPPESKSQQDNATKKSSQEMSEDDMRTLAKFVHNCTLNSKELIVEDFRMTHNGVIPSRAQGHRKIDLIATKRRLKKGGGVIWEVKRRFLESLGLHSLIKKPEPCSDTSGGSDDSKKKKRKKKAIKIAEKVASPTLVSKKRKKEVTKITEKIESPALVSPLGKHASKKRKQPEVSKASANLLASFLKKKKK